jgi:hypothetical protein
MVMTKKSANVLQGYLALSPDEKKEIRQKIDEANAGTRTKEAELREDIKKAHGAVLGPVDNSCPCCGR